jgi:hypothetical protein
LPIFRLISSHRSMASSLRTMTGGRPCAWPPDERPQFEQTITALTDAMRTPDFEEARLERHNLPVHEPVQAALTGSRTR